MNRGQWLDSNGVHMNAQPTYSGVAGAEITVREWNSSKQSGEVVYLGVMDFAVVSALGANKAPIDTSPEAD